MEYSTNIALRPVDDITPILYRLPSCQLCR